MNEDVEDFLSTIEEMLEDERFRFAASMLEGIKSTVTRTDKITEQQRRAIVNIRASKTGEQRKGPNWKRRYEGL